jgi:hypothetical protein
MLLQNVNKNKVHETHFTKPNSIDPFFLGTGLYK